MPATKQRRAQSLRAQRQTFLEHFAANCNVSAAAAVAGVGLASLYRWRRDDPAFAAQWGEALAMGYQLLEARLLAHALAGDRGTRLAEVEGLPAVAVNVDMAMKLMALRRHGAAKGFAGRPRKPVAREDTLNILLKRLELIEKRKRVEAERAAAQDAAPPAEQDGK